MNFKIKIFAIVILSFLSCHPIETSLTIIHFELQNKTTNEPVVGLEICLSGSTNTGVFENIGETLKIGITNPTDEEGKVDYAFINFRNEYFAFVPLGFSGCSERENVSIGYEQTILLKITPPEELIEFHIAEIIDSLQIRSGSQCISDFFPSETYGYIKISNDTVIIKKSIPNDDIFFNIIYFQLDSIYQRVETIHVGEEPIQIYIP